jgi:hypothetical protein
MANVEATPVGLRLNQVKAEIDQQILRSKTRYGNVTEAVGITLGIIAGISNFALSLFKLLTIPHIEVPAPNCRFRNHQHMDPLTHTHSEIKPGYEKYIPLYTINMIIGSIVVGFATFGATYGIGCLISQHKIKQLNLFKDGLVNKYEEQAPLAGDDVVNLLKRIDSIRHQELITHMNFEQLGYAKQALGEKTFTHLISSVQTEQHKQWMALLSLQKKTPKELIVLLNSHEIQQLAQNNPVFANQLKERLSHVQDTGVRQLTDQLWLNGLDEVEPLMSIWINEEQDPIQVNPRLLQQYSPYFKTLLSQTFKEKEGETIRLQEIENPEVFKLCLQLLSHQARVRETTLNKDTVIALFKCANFLTASKLLILLESYMISHFSSFSEEEIEEIIVSCPEFKRLKASVEDLSLNQKDLSTQWKALWEKAEALDSPRLKEKCLTYACTQVKNALATPPWSHTKTIEWFEKYQKHATREAYTDLRSILITEMKTLNLRLLYEMAIANKDFELETKCLEFCQEHAQEIRNHAPWALGTIPQIISQILYPYP